jgi:hypothetical protein
MLMSLVRPTWLVVIVLTTSLLNNTARAEQTDAQRAGFKITEEMRAAMDSRGVESPKAWLGNAILYNYQLDPQSIEVGQKYRLPEARKSCAAGNRDSCATARDIEKWLLWAKSAAMHVREKCDRTPCAHIPGNLIPTGLKGKVWILHAWASWCPYCGLDHLRLAEINAGRHVLLVSMVYQDTETAAAQYLKTHGNPYTGGSIHVSKDILDNLELHSIPATFVIGSEGNVLRRFYGTLDGDGQKALEEYSLN